MNEHDPIIEALRAADLAAPVPRPPADLIDRVHRRRRVQIVRRRTIAGGSMAAAAMALIATVALMSKSPIEPRTEQPKPSGRELAMEAQAREAEADALEKWIADHQRGERLAELTAEHDRLLAALSARNPATAALDRSAASAVCQADFLWETLRDRTAAETAYQNVIEQFPDTRWAMIAQDSLTRLEMN